MSMHDAARQTTLWGSFLIALCAGTNYGFSAYGPQLGAQLHITHTQLNLIALAGNLGVYTSGPFFGAIVDSRGPFILFVSALCLLSTGYMGIRCFYEGLFDFLSPNGISTFAMALLMIFSIFTGLGGNSGFTAAVNATAKSFPDSSRATTTALVLSGFGLSAFLFSTIAHTVFPGDTSSFLLLLSLGTSLPMLVGVFFVRPVPFAPPAPPIESGPSERLLAADDSDRDDIFSPITVGHVYTNVDEEESATPLLASEVSSIAESEFDRANGTTSRSRSPSPNRLSEPMARSASRRGRSRTMSKARDHNAGDHGDVYGKALFRKTEFWMLFGIMSLLSGTGLMWINNVGSIAQALYAHANPTTFATPEGEEASSKLQAAQVSFTSLGNCAGRIIIGLLADLLRNRYSIARPTTLILVAIAFVISQLSAAQVTDPDNLWAASLGIGMAYGGLFGLCPVIVIEWFGLGHFSQNWGFTSWSPLLGANLFSLAFGRNLDKHAPHPEVSAALGAAVAAGKKVGSSSFASTLNPDHVKNGTLNEITRRLFTFNVRAGDAGPKPDASHQCMNGNLCYVDSLYMTAAACTVAFGLCVWAAHRDAQKRAARTRRHLAHT